MSERLVFRSRISDREYNDGIVQMFMHRSKTDGDPMEYRKGTPPDRIIPLDCLGDHLLMLCGAYERMGWDDEAAGIRRQEFFELFQQIVGADFSELAGAPLVAIGIEHHAQRSTYQ